MATTSQSGYPFITDYGDDRLLSNPTVPGSSTKILGGILAGSVATVLLYYAARFNAEVESLGVDPTADDWGFDPQHNNTTTRSNHKSGTAMDLNSTRHPQHQRGTFSAAQYARMRQIAQDVADVAGAPRVLRLGIDWSDRSVDEMHVEIAPDLAGSGVVDRAAAAIRAGRAPNTPAELITAPGDGTWPATPPTTKPSIPTPTAPEDDMTPQQISDAMVAALESPAGQRAIGRGLDVRLNAQFGHAEDPKSLLNRGFGRRIRAELDVVKRLIASLTAKVDALAKQIGAGK